MAYTEIGKLMDKWVNDPNFRKDLKKDPETAVLKMGVHLNKEEMETLKQVDWNCSDEELGTRLSKFFS